MKFKRLAATILSLALITSAFAGCAGNSANVPSSTPDPTSKTEGVAKKDPVEITIAFWDVETAFAGGKDDKLLQQIQTETNTIITPVNITWDDYQQKIQLWASSNQLPDVFAIDVVGTSFYHNWTQQNVVQPLPEDLTKWPTLQKYMEIPDVKALKKSDGKFYVIPRVTWKDVKMSATERKILYRWDLAQAVGITKEPESYDEYRVMLLAIIKADPEAKKIGGMTATQTKQMDSFFMPYSVPLGMGDGSGSDFKWVKKDGKLVPAYFAGDLQATLQLSRDMYKEGTIEADIALAKTQLSEDKFLQGKSAAILGNFMSEKMAKKWNAVYPDKDYKDCIKILKPLKGKDGTATIPVFKNYWSESYIATKDIAKQEAILSLYEYFLKNEMLVRAGYEGEDFTMKDGIVQPTPGVEIDKKYPITKLSTMVQFANWVNLDLAGDPAVDVYRQMDIDFWNHIDKEITLPEYNPMYTNISTPTKDSFIIKPADDLIEVMTGKNPVDKMYNDLMSKYEKNGLSKMIEEVNAAAK